MAGNSPPRRSSRARTVQSQSHHSSTTSSLSGRPERATRSLNKAASPQKSTPSLSDEPPDESVASTDDIPTRRRRTRAQEQDQEQSRDKVPSHRATIEIEMPGDADEIQEDDEAVRCICGFEEYPGPPPTDEEKKNASKDSIDVDPLLPSDINDEVSGFFVQCDVCKVWQHGACVGIMSEEASPDEYFCEECRKDLHKIHMASNGQKYSHYLPLVRNYRKSTTRSRSPKGRDAKDSRETRSGRQSSITQASKRRSTMNSRDAAYDEEEQLRRAIEASKEDASPDAQETVTTSVTRRTKRGRSESEEKPDSTKRQRTKSKSPAPSEDDNEHAVATEESEESSNNKNGSKTRNGVARTQSSQKEKSERSEREERERQRAEAAKKRNGRAERRRADGSTPASTILVKGLEAQADTDSDPSEELPLATRAASTRAAGERVAVAVIESKAEATSAPEPPPSSQPTPDTPPTSAPAQTTSKTKRTKKKGRNQYTKDREPREETSPVRSQSRDAQGHDNGNTHHGHGHGHAHAHAHGHSHGHGHGKSGETSSKSHSRAKGGFNSKVSMTDMKRKAHAMLDYISRTQVEMAGETTPPDNESRRPSDSTVPQTTANGTSAGEKKTFGATNGVSGSSTDAPRDFKELSSMEMMDHLTRDLVKWQKEFL